MAFFVSSYVLIASLFSIVLLGSLFHKVSKK